MANPWYAHYPADYEAKTAHLSLMEDGAYRRLLDHYYRIGRALPANAELLPRVCRAFADDERAAVLKVLYEFFHLEEDGWHNDRADEELAKATQISEKRRVAGKKGAEKTNGKSRSFDAANARQLPVQHNTTQHISNTPLPPKGDQRAKRLTEEYEPKDDHRKIALEGNVNLEEELKKFKDHFLGNGKRMIDWDATFRNWLRNSRAYSPKPKKHNVMEELYAN